MKLVKKQIQSNPINNQSKLNQIQPNSINKPIKSNQIPKSIKSSQIQSKYNQNSKTKQNNWCCFLFKNSCRCLFQADKKIQNFDSESAAKIFCSQSSHCRTLYQIQNGARCDKNITKA